MRRVLCLLAAAFATGCFGIPTPLAPGVSGSVGIPQGGVLTDGVELPVRGPAFRRYRPRSPNYWGNPRMIAGIQQAARIVDEALPGGHPLVVGDISAKHGGKIPGHRSHQTGRDADFLFYVTTPTGAPIPSPGFINLDTDGLGLIETEDDKSYIRLDVERNWLFVKALLSIPGLEVQWLFVSRGVEAQLIDYALARGEPLELVWRAATVLLQPGDSSPHADHFHLRIACTPAEMVAGCEGGGPYWPWLELPAAPSFFAAPELRELARTSAHEPAI